MIHECEYKNPNDVECRKPGAGSGPCGIFCDIHWKIHLALCHGMDVELLEDSLDFEEQWLSLPESRLLPSGEGDIGGLDLEGDDIIEKQDAEESTCADTTCPGCGMIVDADNCTATRPDGTIPIGSDGKPTGVYHGSCEPPVNVKRPFHIEFELADKKGTRLGFVCSAMDEHDAIQIFMDNYSRSMGTIVAIRVTGDA